MFFVFLLTHSLSKKPIILIPGMFGSQLYANFTDARLEWFCPKDGENILLWGNPLRFIGPNHKCTFGLLTESWNYSTRDLNRYPNISIGPNSFGPLDSINRKWSIGPFHASGDFSELIKAFMKHGYKPGYDLLAAPYDWRRAPMYLDSYYTKLKKLIELTQKSTKREVTLISYDIGSLVMQRFLHKNVTKIWKNKYIRRAVMIAPDIAGSLQPFLEMETNKTEKIPLLKNNWFGLALRSWASEYARIPNFNVYNGREVWIQYPITNISTYQIANHFVQRSFVTGAPIVGLNRTLRLLRKELDDIDVQTTVIYNSGIETVRTILYPNGYNRKATYHNGEGDGEVLTDGVKYICKKWSKIRCIDLKNSGKMFRHKNIIKNPYVVDLAINASIDPAYSVKGRWNEVSPKVYIAPFVRYFYSDGPKPRKLTTDL